MLSLMKVPASTKCLEIGDILAEREGFEPSERLRAQRVSSSKTLVPTCAAQWLSVFFCWVFLDQQCAVVTSYTVLCRSVRLQFRLQKTLTITAAFEARVDASEPVGDVRQSRPADA